MATAGRRSAWRFTIAVIGKASVVDDFRQQKLLALPRTELGLTGTKPGCDEGECGACTVPVEGSLLLACQTTAAELDGRSVTTIS